MLTAALVLSLVAGDPWALGADPSGAPAVSAAVPDLGAPDAPGPALLSAAARAQARGDVAARDRFLRGWASLGGQPAAPADLAAPADQARAWAATAGAFRLFASRHGDRVRIGLHDPAQLGARIEATGRTADRAMTLARADVEAPGRIEHVLDPALGADARVEIRAWCDAVEPPLLLRRFVVGGAEAGPGAPDPTSLRGAPERLRAATAATAVTPESSWPWWWFAAGAVALGLAGAAVYQETQP